MFHLICSFAILVNALQAEQADEHSVPTCVCVSAVWRSHVCGKAPMRLLAAQAA